VSRDERKADEMFDLLASYPELARDEIVKKLDLGGTEDFHHVKGVLQDILGNAQDINLVARKGGPNEPWIYSLQGLPTHEIAEFYLQQKSRGNFLRLRRLYMVARSLASGLDPATLAARLARIQQRTIWRALEDTYEVLVEYGIAGGLEMPPQ
jgi:hypothetical protein